MITATCAHCTPPRAPNIPIPRPATTVHSSGAVQPTTLYATGLVVVHTKGGKKQVIMHGLDAANASTRIVHIHGNPFVWAFEEILARAPNLKVIELIPSMVPKCHPESHLRLCRERGVELKAGHVRPDLVWEEDRAVSRQYDGQRRFLLTLAGAQRDLFDELIVLGFEAAAMARRYYRLDGEEERITQSALAREYGMREAQNHVVSETVLSVLYYLDDSVEVGDRSKQRAGAMRERVERLRPYIASAEPTTSRSRGRRRSALCSAPREAAGWRPSARKNRERTRRWCSASGSTSRAASTARSRRWAT
jgi:hypothetical protein